MTRLSPHTTDQRILPLFHNSVGWWILVGVIFAVGLGVRLFDLPDPPLDFHPTRQIHSALIARGMYYGNQQGAPAERRELAVALWGTEGLIEPQVFERLTATIYDWTGGPDLQIPRLFAIAFWMVGAVFLVWLAVQWVGWGGSLVAGVFFLAWPYGVIASRAFQPEPLLVMLIILALLSAMRWYDKKTWGWAVAAGLLSGLSIYIKAVAVFFVGPALLALALSTGWRAALRTRQLWVMALLAVLPYAVYHIDGVYLRGYLVSQFSQRFFPEMWIDPAFYLRWISNLGRVAPFELVLAALLGTLLVRKPFDRVLMAMWIGYFLYAMTLPHHISTHDYYHLPLFPVLALGVGAVGETIFRALHGPAWLARAAAAGVLLAALVMNAYAARNTLKRFDASQQARAYEQIGQALGPGASVVALTDDYGSGLKYWAWINPMLWQTTDDMQWRESQGEAFDYEVFFAEQTGSRDYFVVTSLEEFERQPRLKELLAARYPLLQETPDYLIFDLRP